MSSVLYLYDRPFVVSALANKDSPILDYLSEDDRKQEEEIHACIKKTAVDMGLCVLTDGIIKFAPCDQVGNWRFIVRWSNVRSWSQIKQFDILHQSIFDNGTTVTLSLIVDLHARLGALYDHRLLNTMVNRIYQSLDLMAYPGERAEMRSWEQVHLEAPYLWVIILMQYLVRTHGQSD